MDVHTSIQVLEDLATTDGPQLIQFQLQVSDGDNYRGVVLSNVEEATTRFETSRQDFHSINQLVNVINSS